MAPSRVTRLAQVSLGRAFAFGSPSRVRQRPYRNLLRLDNRSHSDPMGYGGLSGATELLLPVDFFKGSSSTSSTSSSSASSSSYANLNAQEIKQVITLVHESTHAIDLNVEGTVAAPAGAVPPSSILVNLFTPPPAPPSNTGAFVYTGTPG